MMPLNRVVAGCTVLAALVLAAPAATFAQTPAPSAAPSPAASASPGAVPSPGASAMPNPAVDAIARAEYAAWKTGKIDRSRYDAAMNKALNDAVLQQVGAGLTGAGQTRSFTRTATQSASGVTAYTYRVVCENGVVDMQLSLDADGKIAGIYFRPGT